MDELRSGGAEEESRLITDTLINSMSSLLASGVVRRRRATAAHRWSLLLQRLMRWAVFSSASNTWTI